MDFLVIRGKISPQMAYKCYVKIPLQLLLRVIPTLLYCIPLETKFYFQPGQHQNCTTAGNSLHYKHIVMVYQRNIIIPIHVRQRQTAVIMTHFGQQGANIVIILSHLCLVKQSQIRIVQLMCKSAPQVARWEIFSSTLCYVKRSMDGRKISHPGRN